MTDTTPEVTETETETPTEETAEVTEASYVDEPLQRAEITFTMRVENVESVGEAMDLAAINLARYGLDAMNILISDLDSQAQFMVMGGEIADVTDLAAHDDNEEPVV